MYLFMKQVSSGHLWHSNERLITNCSVNLQVLIQQILHNLTNRNIILQKLHDTYQSLLLTQKQESAHISIRNYIEGQL